MKPHHQHSRINLAELKAQIVKKLGPERSNHYFYNLQRFLSSKLSKVEFDKLCLRVLGRQNVPLHNQLICSILRNACSSKASPPGTCMNDVQEHGAQVVGKEIPRSHISMAPASGSPGLSNGTDMLSISPQKARAAFRHKRSGGHNGAPESNGMASYDLHFSSATQLSDSNIALENGNSDRTATRRPLQHHQEIVQQPGNESETLADVPTSVYRKGHTKLVSSDDGKDASTRSQLQAPFGVPLCLVSTPGACRALPPADSGRVAGAFSDGALSDSFTLRERMEHIVMAEGLEGVTMDCANILNHGLDSYLKGLVSSCIGPAGARSGINSNSDRHHSYMKLIAGVKPSHELQIRNTSVHLEVQEQNIHHSVSLQDFRVAMELNPMQLGEDWPLLLENICTRAFEE